MVVPRAAARVPPHRFRGTNQCSIPRRRHRKTPPERCAHRGSWPSRVPVDAPSMADTASTSRQNEGANTGSNQARPGLSDSRPIDSLAILPRVRLNGGEAVPPARNTQRRHHHGAGAVASHSRAVDPAKGVSAGRNEARQKGQIHTQNSAQPRLVRSDSMLSALSPLPAAGALSFRHEKSLTRPA